jgi:hypothetical protein
VRRNWQEVAERAHERMQFWAAHAEDFYNRALRERRKRHVAGWIANAERASRNAERAHNRWLDALDKVREQERRRERYEREQLRKYQARRAEEIKRPAIVVQEEWEEFGDELHAEWEFGAEYDADSGPDSDVDINFRVVRVDARPFGAREATEVMKYVREHSGEIPSGYVVRAVQWRSPEKKNPRWKTSANVRDVTDNLADVMDRLAKQPQSWRLGAPKD